MKPFLIIIYIYASLSGQTTSQIRQAKEFIKSKGLSNNEVREAAKAKGYTEQQIDQVLKNNLEVTPESQSTKSNLQNNLDKQFIDLNSNNLNSNNNGISKQDDDLETEDLLKKDNEEKIIFSAKPTTPFNAQTYFGYDIFSRDPSLFQGTSIGAIDPDYIIGPGDEIIVMLWGETEFRQVLTVNREGFVFLQEVGQVFVNGLNLNLLESKLFKVLSQSYASLNPSAREATTFLDVSLGNLRPLRIQVLGEVAQPGAYTISPSATLFSSLYYFNGPTRLGSLRDIRLIRAGKEVSSIDFYDYLLTGKKLQDEKLQIDDVIFIPKRLRTIAISGAINKPGIYELKEGETLLNLLSFARDLKNTAYLDRVQIDRIVPFNQRDEMGLDRKFIDINLKDILNSGKKLELQDGDRIHIFSIFDSRTNFVTISGAVTRTGQYEIIDSLKISDLIEKSDGLLGDAYTLRADVLRTYPNLKEELIKINIDKALLGDSDHNILLKNLDQVKIYRKSEMIPRNYVGIGGHVKNPGRYLLYENMTIYDLIFQAGGFLDEDWKNNTYLKRAELIRYTENNESRKIIPFDLGLVLKGEGVYSMPLIDNDFVNIFSNEEILGDDKYVEISGEVKRPGRYILHQENMTVYDLIFQTGGLDDPSFKSRVFLSRADIIRYDDQNLSKIISFNLEELMEGKGHSNNLKLKPKDLVRVYSKNIFQQGYQVRISGKINNPGAYTYKQNMNMKDLIIEAGGLSKDLFLYKVEIARLNPNETIEGIFANTIIFEIDNNLEIISGDSSSVSEYLLKPYDYVFIRPDPFFSLQKMVKIQGAVHYPGEYAILNQDEKISDIIKRAGGLRGNAYPTGSSFSRSGKTINMDIKKIIRFERSKQNISVQDGDEIIISFKPEMVEILGEINSPGFYKYEKNKRIRDMINISGGLSSDADTENIFITYPSGISKKYSRWFGNYKVLDGSIILVGRKPEEEPFDVTNYVKDLTQIIASFAQTISIILIASQN